MIKVIIKTILNPLVHYSRKPLLTVSYIFPEVFYANTFLYTNGIANFISTLTMPCIIFFISVLETLANKVILISFVYEFCHTTILNSLLNVRHGTGERHRKDELNWFKLHESDGFLLVSLLTFFPYSINILNAFSMPGTALSTVNTNK